ncbi:MAG: M4 family metallopeptidase [Saprospiraceae bacterium]|nr:M4 family metallopeptidase [Saprospiraceae bacterium]
MKTKATLIFLLLSVLACIGLIAQNPEPGWIKAGNSCSYRWSAEDLAEPVTPNQFFAIYGTRLGLREGDQMVLISEQTDHLGFTHYRYIQQYQDREVVGGGMILHGKNGGILKANGQIYTGIHVASFPELSEAEAVDIARQTLNGKNIHVENSSLCILPGLLKGDQRPSNLCYRIHLHSERLLEESEVYVDALGGKLIRVVPKVCLGDVEGTANTLYSGTRTITTDENGGIYRLQESTRPLQTLNLNHAVDLGTVTDFTDADNQWTDQVTVLRNVTINAIGPGWWQNIPGDDKPDIFLVIKDKDDQTVVTTTIMENVVPPFSVPLQLLLTNPPYSVSIFEDDNGPSNWGGPFTISTSLGVKSFSILGNTGTYETVKENNPALDAHWGVEQTYDYFLNVHNRESYDGMGGEIKTYVHYGIGWPNAFWSNNSLKLGDGDGIEKTYRTYINVVSHEISHGVINTNGGGGLQYLGESGALNESFADIFGTAVEHYAKPATADWLHGEEGSLIPGEYIRSMEDPRSKDQPDTYGPNDSFWRNPQDTMFDFGGVHFNSGVQNYWFYLLSEGGSGVNENGYSYSVDSIGLEKAEQIAYRNLTQYISASPASNFNDSRTGSLMAAEDLFGAGSPEVIAVQQAWAAVGVGTLDPGPTCMGQIELTDPSGAISDGSGMLDYGNNADCTWLIHPSGANSITLDFSEFDLAPGDTLFIYDGGDANAPVLAALTGTVLPSDVTSSDGLLFLQFTTDGSGVSWGWSLNYSSSSMTYCTDLQELTSGAGSLEDGSGVMSYGNLSDCTWLIQPQDATSITLTFTSMDTEPGADEVRVYDGHDANAPLLGVFSGTQIPSGLTSSGGSLFIHFLTNELIRGGGWSAEYTSTGPVPSCSGQQVLLGSSGTISDGSGSGPYGNNTDCTWLIQPSGTNSITLDFSEFELAPGDTLFVFDGGDLNAPLMAALSGNILPSDVISSDGLLFLQFITDGSGVSGGWSLDYTSSSMSYCTDLQELTSGAGSLEDGSGVMSYGNLSDCTWLIQPQDATSITLTFTSMDTEPGVDEVRVYDGSDANAPLLGVFSGTQIPSGLTSSGGSLFIHFQTNELIRGGGWSSEYISTGPVPSCTGQQVLQGSSGTISDGSGSGPYGDNTECSWLIEVDNANSISLTFSEFDLENGPDSVIVYDGSDQFASVLLQATGTSLPGIISSTDSRLFIRFVTNESGTSAGWSADYAASFLTYCSGNDILTTSEGNLDDGSGLEKYGNGTTCSWLIQPVNTKDITLTFTAFDTEEGYDFVTVYDGENSSAPQLGSFSGPGLPPSVQSTGGAMLITFTTDYYVRLDGWSAMYTSSEITSTEEPEGAVELRMFPNPSSGWITVDIPSGSGQGSTLAVWNGLGQLVEYQVIEPGKSQVSIDLRHQPSGFYQVQWISGSYRRMGKVLLK